MTPYDGASPERRAEIEQALSELRMDDSNAVLFFGSRAQEAVTAVADEMLEGVRGKDAGAAGQALGEMVTALRAMPVAEIDPEEAGTSRAPLPRRETGSAPAAAGTSR